jgi:hypothetical protein
VVRWYSRLIPLRVPMYSPRGHTCGFWVFGSLDFGVPRWIIHDKEDKFSCTRWILIIFDYRDAGFLDPVLGYHIYEYSFKTCYIAIR